MGNEIIHSAWLMAFADIFWRSHEYYSYLPKPTIFVFIRFAFLYKTYRWSVEADDEWKFTNECIKKWSYFNYLF